MVKSNTLREMCVSGTPIEKWVKKFGLYVKREDLCCPKPGPPFSKTRGVFAHIKKLDEKKIGVLDTRHSQAGHAVARACQILGKKCYNFYPVYKHEPDLRSPQLRAKELGAQLIGLPAGRSCILYHAARKQTEAMGGYLMPNALKLEESVSETAKEVPNRLFDQVIIPASSGTIAAGVIQGFVHHGIFPTFIVHLGYSRSHDQVRRYLSEMSGVAEDDLKLVIIDEGYAYKDAAKPGPTPPWASNEWYDLKAFRWWMRNRTDYTGKTLFWNIG